MDCQTKMRMFYPPFANGFLRPKIQQEDIFWSFASGSFVDLHENVGQPSKLSTFYPGSFASGHFAAGHFET
jgi:hypothetical protein